MLRFPNEEQRATDVQKNLAAQFSLIDRVYDFWLTQPKADWLDKSRLPGRVLYLAMALDIQACRQVRSVVEECRRCEAFNANIVARSLFETVLAQQFVLAKRVRIVVEPIISSGKPKVTSSGVPKFSAKRAYKGMTQKRKDWLSRSLRAYLYVAHASVEEDRAEEKLSKIRGVKKAANTIGREKDPNATAFLARKVGPEWSYILCNRPHTYSGLSISTLAEILDEGLFSWYESVYHFQSRMVHATDALRHVQAKSGGGNEPSYLSSDGEVDGTLTAATAMFLGNISVLQNNIGFGSEVEKVLTDFASEFLAFSPGGTP